MKIIYLLTINDEKCMIFSTFLQIKFLILKQSYRLKMSRTKLFRALPNTPEKVGKVSLISVIINFLQNGLTVMILRKN